MSATRSDSSSPLVSPTRARTRAALVEAALRLFARKSVGETPIHEIAKEAGVSNGSFYNHFQTREDLVQATGEFLVRGFAEQITASSTTVSDPAERVAIGTRRFLQRAAHDPVWGAAVLGMWNSTPIIAKRASSAMRQDLRAGRRAGRFTYGSDRSAIDLVQGTVLSAIRTILQGSPGKKHARDVCTLILTGLGVPAHEAAALAAEPLPPLERKESSDARPTA